MRNKEIIGKVFKTRCSGDLVVTEYINNRSVYVKFLETRYTTITDLVQIKKGNVKDRLLPSVYGVGILGDASTFDEYGKKLKTCHLWYNVLRRCYSVIAMEKHPTYKGCTVSDSFKYYPYFKEWCEKQVGFNQEGWHLDKDIISKGNKVYSEDTCCFVPIEINNLFTKRNKLRGDYPIGVWYSDGKFVSSLCRAGEKRKYLGVFTTEIEAFQAYKQAKEAYIKEIANKWKDQIDPRAYEALMSYEVEITD